MSTAAKAGAAESNRDNESAELIKIFFIIIFTSFHNRIIYSFLQTMPATLDWQQN
ncbi:hypothetical protein HMPREF9413_3829 [Paenibacillus sp. HGF7]|nr:hypothetical protein HMPREF9413_3829 [Paenibacillus sp. HGF7]